MTRINAFIPNKKIIDSHLMAEIKEHNQLCGQYQKSLNSKNGIVGIPDNFTLGKGHVKFFYNKGLWLEKRFNKLVDEAHKRGFNVTAKFNRSVWRDSDYNDWNPTETEIKRIKNVLIERITERITNQKLIPRYYSNNIDKSDAIKLLTNNI